MKILCGAAAVAMLGCSVGCAPSKSPEPLDLVPASAVAVADVRWRDARAHTVLKPMAELPPTLADLTRLDVPLDALESVVFFNRSLSEAAAETVILKGTGLGSRFVTAAGAAGWQPMPLADTTAYFAPGPGDAAALAVDDHILVAGSREAVKAFGSAPRTLGAFVSKPEFMTVAKAFADPSPVRMMVAWPAETLDRSRAAVATSAALMKFAGLGLTGSIVERLGIGRAYVIRLAPDGNDVRVNLAGVLEDEDTAATVAGGLSLLKAIAGLIPPAARQGQPDPTASLTVERTGAVVWVGLRVSESGLR
jgi:hypothetical protein